MCDDVLRRTGIATVFVLVVAVSAAAAEGTAAPGDADPLPTGFVYDELYLEHDTGPTHPEQPERLTAIISHLQKRGVMDRLQRIAPSPAPLEWVHTVHSAEYVAEMKRACRKGRPWLHSGDTPISERSYEVALLAAGGVLSAVDAVMAGEVRNAFCAVRPPGHHALADRAMGFCLLNNVAIAARYAQQKYGLERILIVDWDVHHGNGTQAAFYEDPTVLYFSAHQYPFYPGTGAEDDRGTGEGEGYTVNVPLPAGTGDEEFIAAFADILKPRALAFAPDFVLISCGFDGHERDPIGGMALSSEAYAMVTRVVKDIARQCCEGRIVSVLEGGYDTRALAESAEYHLPALLEKGS